jgi:pyrroline-5-carboxylate reductase
MGSAMIAGWLRAGAFKREDILVRDPSPGPEALKSGVNFNPTGAEQASAKTIVLVVKPQIWSVAAGETQHDLAPDAVVVSIAAGVAAADIATAFNGRRVARVMPTTAVAICRGPASVYAADPVARQRAHALFDPVSTVVDLTDEDQMHAATAVSGSAPAYLYAFVEALEAAGAGLGLAPHAARDLARATISGAAALMADSGADPAELRRQVTSPGGTTEAALRVLMGDGGLEPLLRSAAKAASERSRDLGK